MNLLLGSFGTTEIVVIVFLALLLFGGKKIPEFMKGLGLGLKEFREAIQGQQSREAIQGQQRQRQ
ncbi:Sec-independent protein translocase subunit TatA/TatB [Candidatus Karelsulcia muelleri]|uniref:Sec-independent protein translocase subunit TatA/TatB n=1 Tax=Candidatus Karelsulcia muelleri TaxID=336810 RepID=UPI000D7BD33E|nr:twin-arginine translocase TatA/TatE family subunit [Candidatus Karelsulcia muelleri]